uniref:Uncharacterized protein n=1 Tax=Siphoviridae sp. ctNEy24 TaxID=2825466 RepID=A0A8S5U0R0_9CAUD|nr:MAG TPA: hypothetical protein [Siphoviridae sp. ctNEy24]
MEGKRELCHSTMLPSTPPIFSYLSMPNFLLC